MFKRTIKAAAAAIALSLALGAGAAYAAFTDVPPSSPWYPTVEFISERGITGGCGGGNYCPSDPVTRGQMSAFLQRSARVLTPQILREAEQTGSGLVFCETPPYVVPGYEQTAYLTAAWSSVATVDDTNRWANVQYSTNGGSNWASLSGQVTIAGGPAGFYTQSTEANALALFPSTTYLFRMVANSATDVTGGQCELVLTTQNRMPGQAVGGSSAGGTATGAGTAADEG